MDFNLEAARDELDGFEKESNNVSPLLENYLQVIAKTGNTLFPWNKLQPLLRRKMELVLIEFTKTCPPENIPSLPNTEAFDFDTVKGNLLDAVDTFSSAPFTIQRLCELIVNPKKHYSRTDKYMRGLEKNLLVVSTVESLANENNTRNQIPVVNGRLGNSADVPYEETNSGNDSSLCSTPPPNGPVLENFASVFPSANRIAPPSNNIQVPVISDSNDFLPTECVEDFNYDINENVSVNPIENGTNEIMSENVGDSAFVSNSNDTSSVTSSDTMSDDSLSSESSVISEDITTDTNLSSDTSTDTTSETPKVTTNDNVSVDSNSTNCDSVSTTNETSVDSEEKCKNITNTDDLIEEEEITKPSVIEKQETSVDEDVNTTELDNSENICSTSSSENKEDLDSANSSNTNCEFQDNEPYEPSPKRRKIDNESNEESITKTDEIKEENLAVMTLDIENKSDNSEDEVHDEIIVQIQHKVLSSETKEADKSDVQDVITSNTENLNNTDDVSNVTSSNEISDDCSEYKLNNTSDVSAN